MTEEVASIQNDINLSDLDSIVWVPEIKNKIEHLNNFSINVKPSFKIDPEWIKEKIIYNVNEGYTTAISISINIILEVKTFASKFANAVLEIIELIFNTFS